MKRLTTVKGVLKIVRNSKCRSADLIHLHLVSDPKYRSLSNMKGENEDDIEAGRSRQ